MRVFTDGACSGNPGPGGWGWVTEDGRSDHGGEPQTTNQRMELRAVLEAITTLEGPLAIHSDSTYVVNCFNDRWYEGWKTRGWKNSQKKPVANRDLWEPLIDRYLERSHEIDFTWVKGHAGHELNEIADQLAVAGAAKAKEALQEEANSAARDQAEAPWPLDRSVWVVGTTSPDEDQRRELERAVDGLRPEHDVLVSGLRRGTELEAAERAVLRGVEVHAVLPFADPARSWPPDDRDRFDRVLAAAAEVVTLDGDPAKPAESVASRNQWITATVPGAVVVGDADLAERLDGEQLSVRRL